MSNSPNLHEPVCLLSRFHNSTVLKKYGSSQKGLRTRKNKIKDIFKSQTKTTNNIDFFYDAHGISLPVVFHWMPAVLDIVLLVSSFIYKGVVTCIKTLSHHVFSGRRVTSKSISSLNQHVLVEYMIILVLVFLSCTAASPDQSNTGCGNKNVAIILAITATVAIASKIKVGTGNKESSLKSDMWTNSTKHFKDGEGETVLENRHGDDFAVWGLLDQHSKNVVVCNVLKFLRPKEVATLVAVYDQKHKTTRLTVKTKNPNRSEHENMARSFVDCINWGDEREAALENQRVDDCRSLLLFQKYNIKYPKKPKISKYATRASTEKRKSTWNVTLHHSFMMRNLSTQVQHTITVWTQKNNGTLSFDNHCGNRSTSFREQATRLSTLPPPIREQAKQNQYC